MAEVPKSKNRFRWMNMLSRCYDEDHLSYSDYGGRGIYVCDDWHDFEKFHLWCTENGMEGGLELDRQDNSGPYAPGNCRFITKTENIRNRRNTVKLTAFGETKALYAWAEDDRCVVDAQTLHARTQVYDWEHEQAIIQPAAGNAGIDFIAFGEVKTLTDWSNDSRCIVPQETLYARVTRFGWPVERAMTEVAMNNETRLLIALGREMTITEWSNQPECQVNRATLTRRIELGWDHEKAITTPPNGTRKGRKAPNESSFTAWGETKTMTEWLADDRCTYKKRAQVWARINKSGWSPEKAMTEPPGRGRPKKS